jgi:hypothetical protein
MLFPKNNDAQLYTIRAGVAVPLTRRSSDRSFFSEKSPGGHRLAFHVLDDFDVPGIVDQRVADSHRIFDAAAVAGAYLE